MRSKLLVLVVLVALFAVACGGTAQQAVEQAAPTLEAAIEEVAPTVQAAVEEIAPTVEAAATAVAEEPAAEEPAAEEPAAEMPAEEVVPGVLPMADPLAVTGDIVTAGSSTVFPLTERMAERYQSEGFAGQITVDSIGTGAGFERFCEAGETDVANASRPIREEEVALCAAIDRTPIEFRVGTDALAVVVNPANEFVESLTLEQLAVAFSTAETWADVDPSFPAEPITRYSPGTDSGTFDYFVEEVFDEDDAPILSAANIQFSEDDNVLVQGVEGDVNAIGYFGYAFYADEADRLTIVSIEGVEPTAEHVEDGTYPLARPLFLYSDAAIMQAKPQVADFVNFYLSFVNEEINDVGYFPASAEALEEARMAWQAGMGLIEPMAPEAEAPAEGAAMAAVMLPMADPLAVTGDIVTAGSSTVFPLTERMAERYQSEGFAGQITVDSIGSGAGFERFCVAGESDISNASRPIDEEEVASCESIDRMPLEFRVGTDALAVVVNPANEFATNLTLEQLAVAFSTAETWADVDPSFPAEPIVRYSPGTDSGTFDYFVEEVFDEDTAPILSAANTQFSEDDNVLVQGVEGDVNAIGYFGYAFYADEADRLKIISIEGVEPSAEHVEDGTYPLARPLFIYSDANIMQSKAQVADFINFYLTYVNEEIEDVGYFPASEDALNAARQTWLTAIGQ
jgi:phosphate binding protein